MERSENSVYPAHFLGPEGPTTRKAIKQAVDGILAAAAWVVADQMWFSSPWSLRRTAIWVLFSLTVGSAFQVTSPLYRLTTIRDITRLGYAILTLLGISLLLKFVPGFIEVSNGVPATAAGASLLTGMMWATVRLAARTGYDNRSNRSNQKDRRTAKAHPTLLVGAGKAGSLVAQELSEHPELGYRVKGFIDDSPEKQGALINGVRVLGQTGRFEQVVHRFGITHAILAMPTASGQVIRKLVADFQRLDVKVKTVPGIFNLLGSRTWKPDIQEISIEDVLRREPVQLDPGAMSEALNGKVVLITGAGGSIGRELSHLVAGLKPKFMILLGRGENSLWLLQQDLTAAYPDQEFMLALVDIRNRAGIREIFERFHPEIVLHTAAHKHVPFLELHPSEAVDNNIFGTLNVVEAAQDYGAQRMVNISTDKAVNPTNVLGATKRIAECIVQNRAAKAGPGTVFVSVRFGNVLGSRGSVVPIFKQQIERGGPLTVTSAEMTRFFMTIPEASQLVLQAALFGETGRVYVLNMGEAVKIIDLASEMARLSGLVPGRDIMIDIVGLRPGEKLFEELFHEEERTATQVHPKIAEVNPRPIPEAELTAKLEAFRRALSLPYEERQPAIVDLLKDLVPTYKPSPLGVGRYGGHVKDRRVQTTPVLSSLDRRQKA